LKFGPRYQRSLKRREGRLGDDWYADEAFIQIAGEQYYLWRAVDQDGDVLDILLQKRRNQKAAERFLRKAMFLLCEKSFQVPIMIAQNTRTTVRKIHINTPVVGSVKCNGSNRHNKRNDFLDCMRVSAIYFDTEDT